MQCKKRPPMFHTFLLNPLARTLFLKKYQVTSSRAHETSHDQCTCTTAARSKQTSAAGSAASKETSRRCATGGYSWCTYWHHHEISGGNSVTETNPMIKPFLSHSRNDTRACTSFDFRLGLHIVLFANLQIHRVLFALVFGH